VHEDPVALVIVDDIARAYDFGSSHPLRPERVTLTLDTLRSLGMTTCPHVREAAAGIARDEQVTAVHDPDFVEAVKAIDEGRMGARDGLEFGLGTPDNPIFANMHGASKAVCGASVAAAELVASGEVMHAFNPAGGLHHARRREASGFCIYNDPAVAIAAALELQPDWRVLYVDVDVHHGDGVQWIFYDDPRVLTVSLHQSGRYLYPGTGFEEEIGTGAAVGTAANIPLLPFTCEKDYLWALEEVLYGLSAAFKPHLLVTQLGADTHHGDPLASLGLTMAAYPRMAALLHETAHRFSGGRWVATGGGGYQATTIVPKVWTIHFAEMCEARDLVPDEFLDDVPSEDVSKSYRDSVEESVSTVLEACIPRIARLPRES
jgi:acetoin utilization protein AcuC